MPDSGDYAADRDQNDPQRPVFFHRIKRAWAARDGVSATGNLRCRCQCSLMPDGSRNRCFPSFVATKRELIGNQTEPKRRRSILVKHARLDDVTSGMQLVRD